MKRSSRNKECPAITIRLLVHMNESMNKFLRASRELDKELGRRRTNEEIGRWMDISGGKGRDAEMGEAARNG